jgi:hypothetical protein
MKPAKEFTTDQLTLELYTQSTPWKLVFKGTYAPKIPNEKMLDFISECHESIMSQKQSEILADLFELEFVNSSALRIFLYWLGLINKESNKYAVTFYCNPEYFWQEVAFKQMEYILPGYVKLDVAK